MLTITYEGESSFEQSQTQRVWSLVHKDGATLAVYYAEWSLEQGEFHETKISIVLGKWGDQTLVSDRFWVFALYRDSPKPGFMIVEPGCPANWKQQASRRLSRDEVLGQPEIKEKVFAILDVMWGQDHRINWGSGASGKRFPREQ